MDKNSDCAQVTENIENTRGSRLAALFRFILPLLILGAGTAGAAYLYATAPVSQKIKPPRQASLVYIEPVRHSSEQVIVHAMGTVIPAREIVLKARVAGEVKAVNPDFMTGSAFKAGDKLVELDSEDYRLNVVQKEGQVAAARYELKMEMGQQVVAQREWELLDKEGSGKMADIDLVLRKPHLAKAQASLAAAEAELRQAQLDLERTIIRAPFDCLLRNTEVHVGSHVSAQDELAGLVGIDEYWVQASVPVDRLRWISIPGIGGGEGAKARVIYGNGYEQKGTVIKLLGDLEEEGRMARILVSVKYPLNLKSRRNDQPPLLIGEYVKVAIEGLSLDDVVRIQRSALRDNSNVWIAGDEDTLEIRPVEVVWRDAGSVLVKNSLQDGERLIVSDISTPVQGLKLQIAQ